MKKLLTWFKKAIRIVRRHDWEVQSLHQRIDRLEGLIRERTDIAASAGYHGESHVVVMGRYKGADYVETFHLGTEDLCHIIDTLRHLNRTGRVTVVDAPPSFRAIVKNQL